jgi:hypothetical protein
MCTQVYIHIKDGKIDFVASDDPDALEVITVEEISQANKSTQLVGVHSRAVFDWSPNEFKRRVEGAKRQYRKNLLEANKAEYLKSRGQICPYCKSHDIEGTGSSAADDNWHQEEVRCKDCGLMWHDIYILTDITLP